MKIDEYGWIGYREVCALPKAADNPVKERPQYEKLKSGVDGLIKLWKIRAVSIGKEERSCKLARTQEQ